ncbi:hypothetical protein BBJ29_007462 [Phytophthora kernoviae]|uniref:PX domain-containing protein n=1 Tax=Phytophthora kernoviae TaxID=325452 RepID=A0A3F2S2I1_9STRA|nr:hypothetical protein BBP00_00000527 [Phytophthora kernoviae]RLN70815.1 hypothetical protein BBJ29_007462 [Phytophthora kernoviae]
MGCSQSKTNEHEVVNPNDAVGEGTDTVVAQQTVTIEGAATTKVEEEVPTTTEETLVNESEEVDVATKEEPTVEVKTPIHAFQFVPGEISFDEYGVAFYNFDGSNPAEPSQDIHVCKRYSEFKDMRAEISKLMASEKNVAPDQQDKFQTYPALPSMPKANAVTYLLGRGNKKVVNEREAQFVKILNAISRHPIAFQSKTFTDFIAPSRTYDPLNPDGLEFSLIELSIAKRPGGAEVGPMKAEVSEVVAQDKKIPDGTLTFSPVKVAANEKGVMFYEFSGSSREDPADRVIISKRYSEFRTMHAKVSEIMASEKNVPSKQRYLFQTHPALPEFPYANVWVFLRSQEGVVEEREAQFTKILNAISRHPVAFQSKAFRDFMAVL